MGSGPMIALTLTEIAGIVGGRLADISAADAAATRITGTVEFDSRAVTPGGLFLALPGARSDGHDFAAAAVEAGAAAVLAARPVGVPAIIVDPFGPAGADSGPSGSGPSSITLQRPTAKGTKDGGQDRPTP